MAEKPVKLFISHASEDKEAFVRGLAAALNANPKFEVWYDEYSLRLGDSLLQSIGKGLRSCNYGIVVISPDFISKKWPPAELDGLFALETAEKKIILPIWHKVDHDDVLAFNPILADRFAIPSTKPREEIIFAIEGATWNAQKAKELANPSFKERAVQIRNQIIERQTQNQLRNSTEGAELVKKSVAFIFNRFDQLIKEQVQDSLPIQTQRYDTYDTPTHSFPCPRIVASGPLNANIEVGYVTSDQDTIRRNRLFMSMFNWDHDFPSVQGKRKERGRSVLRPDITPDREVQWLNEGTDGPYFTSEQIAQEALENLLALIAACSEDAS